MKNRRFYPLVFLLLAIIIVGWRTRPGTVDTPLPPPTPATTNPATTATNIILFVGDGMGPEHVRAARYFLGRPLLFERFPYTGTMSTRSVDGVTDSAAAATAMATGQRVHNDVISTAMPGSGADLPTALEAWQAQGKPVGLVTTSYMTDATPAAFGAHETWRDDVGAIAADYLNGTRPEVLLGGGGRGMTRTAALAAGYVVVTNTVGLESLNPTVFSHFSGQFGTGALPPISQRPAELPTLAQMTETALAILGERDEGFFLLVEQEASDSYSHRNQIELVVEAIVELEEAVDSALRWAGEEEETLILVVADHETGGLTVLQDNGPGQIPDVQWARREHTDTPVSLYATGPGAAQVQYVTTNTQVFPLLLPAPLDEPDLMNSAAVPEKSSTLRSLR
jgi:alkaline phosphatase